MHKVTVYVSNRKTHGLIIIVRQTCPLGQCDVEQNQHSVLDVSLCATVLAQWHESLVRLRDSIDSASYLSLQPQTMASCLHQDVAAEMSTGNRSL